MEEGDRPSAMGPLMAPVATSVRTTKIVMGHVHNVKGVLCDAAYIFELKVWSYSLFYTKSQ